MFVMTCAFVAAGCGGTRQGNDANGIARGQSSRQAQMSGGNSFVWYFSVADVSALQMTNLVGYEEAAGGVVTGGWGQRTSTFIQATSLNASVTPSATSQTNCVVNGVATTCSPGICDLPFWSQCG